MSREFGGDAVALAPGQPYRVILHVSDSQGHTMLVGQGVFEGR